MAPNPIMLPRKRTMDKAPQKELSLSWMLTAAAITTGLALNSQWARRWALSGCAPETLLILYAATTGSRIFSSIPLWTLLASLNLIYSVCSTSWLLYGLFTAACWPSIGISCLFQFGHAADLARSNLRRLLKDLHFTRDRIALFNIPAIEIDTEVAGLMVIRGITVSLSSLTIIAHGVEIGLKLADEIELALHADEVRLPLFRRIEVGDVYGNIKGGKAEMTFAEVEEDEEAENDFFNETPLLRAATASSASLKDRPKLRASLTGVSYIKDASTKQVFDEIRTLSPDNQAAEKTYMDMLTEIRTSSAVYQSRQRVRRAAKAKGVVLDDDKDIRAAICAELHEFPSVPHPPSHSVKVTTLQKLCKPAVRRFLHRVPFLLRLLLVPLGYFHPVSIESINVAGSGQWAKELLQQEVFKSYADNSMEVRRIWRRITAWLNDANFCVQLTDVDALGQVSLSTSLDVVAYLHSADIMAYRTLPASDVLTQVVRLGGADATFTIPSFLLPHHEHLLPPRPTAEDEEEMIQQVEEADGVPKTVQAEKELKKVQRDETEISMSIHASLPASFDQSLLFFVAALVKATKIIEFDKEVEKLDSDKDEETVPLSRSSTQMSEESVTSVHKRAQSDVASIGGTNSRFRAFASKVQQNLKEASISTANAVSREHIKEFVKDVHQQTRDGMKKTLVGSIVNDRWIAKMVGKIAANLERARGDVGYSGGIPVSLEAYRPQPGSDGYMSKILP